LELFEERNPRVADCNVAEATLQLKGTTLRARSASPDVVRSINLVSDEIARQVKRHRDRRRKRRESRAAAGQLPGSLAEAEAEPRAVGEEAVLDGGAGFPTAASQGS
jgi:putative sigma-54 modulation protein